jgi:hypothetical protein
LITPRDRLLQHLQIFHVHDATRLSEARPVPFQRAGDVAVGILEIS